MKPPSADSHRFLARADWLPVVSGYLEQERRHLSDVCEFVQGLLEGGLTTLPGAELAPQATLLAAEMQAVHQQRGTVLAALQQASGQPGVRKLSEFPWSLDERRQVEAQIREVREVAARLIGVTRASQLTLAAWSGVVGDALQTLTGIGPQEAMYSSHGARVPVRAVPSFART